MNYNAILPAIVKRQPLPIRRGYVEVHALAESKYGADKARVYAATWLKSKMMPKGPKRYIKRASLSFTVVEGKKFIKRSSNGDDYITLELANTNVNLDGKQFSNTDLQDFASQINAGAVVGDIDHLLYDKLVNSSLSDESIISILKSKKGIAKTVKAIYEKGKLWVRAIIDKRYKKVIENSKGVSLEAVCDVGSGWNLLGFSFNVNTTPAVPGAGVVI